VLKAFHGTTSVAIKTRIANGSSQSSFDIVSATGGGGGTITINGATYHVVLAPPNLYLKLNAVALRTLTENASASTVFAGKWLQTTSSDPKYTSFVSLLDFSVLAQKVTTSDTYTKGRVTTFHGKSAVTLHVGGTSPNTVYVAATGTPYLLGSVNTGATHGETRYTKYGSAKPPRAPSKSVSLSRLQQAG
jgi:hypothetical protein